MLRLTCLLIIIFFNKNNKIIGQFINRPLCVVMLACSCEEFAQRILCKTEPSIWWRTHQQAPNIHYTFSNRCGKIEFHYTFHIVVGLRFNVVRSAISQTLPYLIICLSWPLWSPVALKLSQRSISGNGASEWK